MKSDDAVKHVLLALLVVWLFLLGTGAIVAPLLAGGSIPFVNGVIGGGSLALAVLLAIPLRVQKALTVVAPYLPFGKKPVG